MNHGAVKKKCETCRHFRNPEHAEFGQCHWGERYLPPPLNDALGNKFVAKEFASCPVWASRRQPV